MTHIPSSIAMSVTDRHKAAVWVALKPPARMLIGDIGRATGITTDIVSEVVSEGVHKGHLRIVEGDVMDRGVERIA